MARELERPRTDVDGRYDRAERLADKYGTQNQRMEVAYQRAWTAHFWHEDFDLFDRLYSVVEDLAEDSDNACHLERLNLGARFAVVHSTRVVFVAKTKTISGSESAILSPTFWSVFSS